MSDTAAPITNRYAPPLSAEAYARCFLTFRQHSTEWVGMLAWCRQRLPVLLPVKEPFRALSVGAGNGDFDWRLLPILRSRLAHLDYLFVEPSRAMCRYLRQRMDQEPVAGVCFDLDQQAFEACALPQMFDLVLLTHCLYYIPERATAIEHALDAAGRAGLVLIFHQTPLGIDQVQQRFIKRVKGSEQEMFTSRDIEDILRGRGIPYGLEQVDSHIDVTACFRPGSGEGEELLSFFLESDVRHLDQALKDELVAYLGQLAPARQGRRLLHHPVAVFTLGQGAAPARGR